MAEYCQNCVKEFGFEAEYDASPCEGCGRYIYKKEKEWVKILKIIGIIMLVSVIVQLIISL